MPDPLPLGSEAVLQIDDLSRRFGAKVAVDRASLAVPRGVVCGLVGANGAGKTTLIKHILGLLTAQSGSVRVFGRDPVTDPVGVLSRIGYLAEENDFWPPAWSSCSPSPVWPPRPWPWHGTGTAEEPLQTRCSARSLTARQNAGRVPGAARRCHARTDGNDRRCHGRKQPVAP